MSFDKVTGFCHWEIGRIGLNIKRQDGTAVFADLTRDDAAVLATQLMDAVREYDDLERMAARHDEWIEKETTGPLCSNCRNHVVAAGTLCAYCIYDALQDT